MVRQNKDEDAFVYLLTKDKYVLLHVVSVK